jgi:hypothetical protein
MNAYLSRFITDDAEAEPLKIDQPKAMPIQQLLALYDALRALGDVALGFSGNHRFQGEGGSYNQAGDFVDRMCMLIGCAADCIVDLAEVATPADKIEFDMRAEILIRHEIACESAASAARLAAEIYGEPREA